MTTILPSENKFRLNIPIQIRKEHLNRLIKEKMPPIELRKNLKLSNIHVDGNDDYFLVDLKVSGIYDGTLKVSFKPSFDKTNHKLTLDNLKIQMKEKGLFSKGLNWMMQGFMQDKIEDSIQSQLDSNLKEFLKMYLKKPQKMVVPEGFLMILNVEDFDIINMFFADTVLNIQLEAEGQLQLKSDSIKIT